jgi:AcrR family transcriptional regulator
VSKSSKNTGWYIFIDKIYHPVFFVSMNEKQPGKKAKRTRHFIIQQAAPIFNKKGYAGTSLSDLIQATGLTKGSIYGNFSGKDEVAICAFQYNVKRLFDAFAEELAHANSYIDQLLVYPNTFRKIYKEFLEQGGCPILNTAVEADDTHPVLRQLAVDTFLYLKTTLCQCIEDGIVCGEITPETNAETIAELIIVLFEGGSALTKATGEESFMLHALDQIDHLIYSLKANEVNL